MKIGDVTLAREAHYSHILAQLLSSGVQDGD